MSTEDEKKKGLFDKAIDALSSRDEKEALEAALEELEAAKQAAAQAQAEAAKAKAAATSATAQAKVETQKAIKEAQKRADEAESKAKTLEAHIQRTREARQREMQLERQRQMEARQAAAAAPKIITEHTLTSEETLSHLALKYYGHATKPYWMVIYEANKDVIGDNPNRVKRGLVLKIPELPPELKD